MIKAIFFDLDDTLIWDRKSVDLAFLATCRKAEEEYGVNPEELMEAVKRHARDLFRTYDTYPFTQKIGISAFEGLWGPFEDIGPEFQALKEIVPSYRTQAWYLGLKTFGIDHLEFARFLGETFPVERRKVPVVFEDTFPVLEQLRHGFRLTLLTNGSPSLQRLKLDLTPELAPFFDHIVISGEFGKGKPDKEIFEYALTLNGVGPSEAIMVGDNLYTDILGANDAHIPSVWIHHGENQAKEVIPTFEIHRPKELLRILPEGR